MGLAVVMTFMRRFLVRLLGLLEDLLEFLSFRDLFLKDRIIDVLKCSYKAVNCGRHFVFSVFTVCDEHFVILSG
jgi:hypothetical protein